MTDKKSPSSKDEGLLSIEILFASAQIVSVPFVPQGS